MTELFYSEHKKHVFEELQTVRDKLTSTSVVTTLDEVSILSDPSASR